MFRSLRCDCRSLTLIALCGIASGCSNQLPAPGDSSAGSNPRADMQAAVAKSGQPPALFLPQASPQPLLFDAPHDVQPVALFGPPPIAGPKEQHAGKLSQPVRLPPLRLPPPPTAAPSKEPPLLAPNETSGPADSLLAHAPREEPSLQIGEQTDSDSIENRTPTAADADDDNGDAEHFGAALAQELRRLPPVVGDEAQPSPIESAGDPIEPLAADNDWRPAPELPAGAIREEPDPNSSRFEPRTDTAYEPIDSGEELLGEVELNASPEDGFAPNDDERSPRLELESDSIASAPESTQHNDDQALSFGPDPAMAAVTSRANQFTRRGALLAERGAYYSARAEFIQALALIAQALDASAGGQQHSEALSAGLRALKEVDDFAPRGWRLEADLNLASIITGHRTSVLHGADAARQSPLTARQLYYDYAQEQLSRACGHEPSASLALFGLGKLHSAIGSQSAESDRLESPKAIVFHQAALEVDARNHLSANEVGVLLARYGALGDARRALVHSVSVQPTAAAWRNLAVVHQRLGELSLARQAQGEWARIVETRGGDPGAGQGPAVQWVDKRDFERGASPAPHADAIGPASPQRRAAGAGPQKRSAAQSSPWSVR